MCFKKYELDSDCETKGCFLNVRTLKEPHTDFCFVCGCFLCRELRTELAQVDAPCCCSQLPGEYPPWNSWGWIVLVAFGVWDPWDKSFHPVSLKIGAGLFSLAWWRGKRDFLGFASLIRLIRLIRPLTQPLTVFLLFVTVLPNFRKHWGDSCVTLHPVQVLFRRFPPSIKNHSPPCSPVRSLYFGSSSCGNDASQFLVHPSDFTINPSGVAQVTRIIFVWPIGFLYKWTLSVLCKRTRSQLRWETAVINFNCRYHIF